MDPAFPWRGITNSLRGHQHSILPNSSNNCMKFKEFGPWDVLCAPLDLPLHMYSSVVNWVSFIYCLIFTVWKFAFSNLANMYFHGGCKFWFSKVCFGTSHNFTGELWLFFMLNYMNFQSIGKCKLFTVHLTCVCCVVYTVFSIIINYITPKETWMCCVIQAPVESLCNIKGTLDVLCFTDTSPVTI